MKLTNTLLTFLTIAFGALAQNKPVTRLNQTLDALNFTEAEALARSLTWYHLDEDDEQKLCGNTDTHLDGKEDILKKDCQELMARLGHWKANGYNKRGIGFADLFTRRTCEFTATREDALNTYFEIGNLDVVDFVEAAMRTMNDATRMAPVHGFVSYVGDFNPSVMWSVDFPISGALASVRMSSTGWAMVGVSIAAFTFL